MVLVPQKQKDEDIHQDIVNHTTCSLDIIFLILDEILQHYR